MAFGNDGYMDRIEAENERLREALDEALDVFRNHDCPQSHLAPECHLCEVIAGADPLLAKR